MEKDPEKTESDPEENKPAKINAEDNPWYLFATLYGVHHLTKAYDKQDIRNKNRTTWNRYFGKGLNEEMRTRLIDEKRCKQDELKPLSPDELSDVRNAFLKRHEGRRISLPPPDSPIDFSNVQFEEADFCGYLFIKTSFANTRFMEDAFFFDATFIGDTSFAGVIFTGDARFRHAEFFDTVYFSEGKFLGLAEFDVANFKWMTYFAEATFHDFTSFRDTKFGGSVFFNKAEMKNRTDFNDAQFVAPPFFYDAKFYEGTSWRRIKWPPPPLGSDVAEHFVYAYACLKREMDRLKKHEDELIFFACELKARQKEQGPVKGLPIAIYGAVSNYGRSYVRPLLWLLGTVAGMVPFFLWRGNLPFDEALGLSIANTFNVFGFRKDFFDSSFVECLPAWIKVSAALQAIFGAIFLFLFGLGIRNSFRMK